MVASRYPGGDWRAVLPGGILDPASSTLDPSRLANMDSCFLLGIGCIVVFLLGIGKRGRRKPVPPLYKFLHDIVTATAFIP